MPGGIENNPSLQRKRCGVRCFLTRHSPVRSRATHSTAHDGFTSLTTLLQELRYYPGPAGLMAGANAGPVVAMEVLVEQDEIPPVRVHLELLRAAMNGPSAVFSTQEDMRQATREFCRHFP